MGIEPGFGAWRRARRLELALRARGTALDPGPKHRAGFRRDRTPRRPEFVGSAVVLDRTLNARDWVQHSRGVQLQIDRIVWDLMRLQQATQSHALNPTSDATASFVQLRDEVHGDLAEIARVTADNPYQQQRVADLVAAFDRYLSNLEMTLAPGAAPDLDRTRAQAMTADVTRVSQLVTRMREHEDGLLTRRIRRADAFFAVLLPTLSFSVAVIAYLVVFVGRAIARACARANSCCRKRTASSPPRTSCCARSITASATAST